MNIQEVFSAFSTKSPSLTGSDEKEIQHSVYCKKKVLWTILLQSMEKPFGRFPIQGDFSDGGVTFFFSEFSFNCTNGQYNGLWRCGDKRSGPETEPMCIEFQAILHYFRPPHPNKLDR